ncbi:MAG: nitrous oxide-stimulated promoter family protein [Ignavibacteriae bacterium]|nr:nitrous oxide-stimulated promoter family protein [Ignavibacteriota bacterium]
MENKNEKKESRRIKLEQKTIYKMIRIYCFKVHKSSENLCEECRKLNDYAYERLQYCPFGDEKPVCSECEVHCYKSDMREKVKKVMRFSGPRMIFKHPYLAVMHILSKKTE